MDLSAKNIMIQSILEEKTKPFALSRLRITIKNYKVNFSTDTNLKLMQAEKFNLR